MTAQERYEKQNKGLDSIKAEPQSDIWWAIKDKRKQLEIAWAQSYNLAIQDMLSAKAEEGGGLVDSWAYHYENLTLNISNWIKLRLK